MYEGNNIMGILNYKMLTYARVCEEKLEKSDAH